MAVIKEFWTNGNLIINNTGGINFNVLDLKKSWELQVKNRTLILNEHTRGIDGTNYYPLLSFKIREEKITELIEFFNAHNVRYRLIEE